MPGFPLVHEISVSRGGDMRKYSRQREAICEYLSSRKDHPTADMVFQAVRQVYPKISLGTVYRNLTLLADEGEILKLNCGDGVEHYDAQTAPHCHYYCRACGSLKDISLRESFPLLTAAESSEGDSIEGCNLMFYGICGKCKNTVDKAEGM